MKRKSAVLALAVVVLSVTAVQAVPTTYVYTGNPFQFTTGLYGPSNFVTAMVTLDGPLPADLMETLVTPLSFSLFDGHQTITNLNATESHFEFATGPSATITLWQASVSIGISHFIRSLNDSSFGFPFDQGVSSPPTEGSGFISRSPGAWATAAAPDAGSSLALLSLSLTALGVTARQFERAAA